MTLLTVAVPAKINIHLQILGARSDNHHEVWTLYQSIDLFDEISVGDGTDGTLSLVVEPAGAAPGGGDNLVLRAASVLSECTGVRRGAEILLRKRIPVGAGLGGGSADAAAVLVALNRLWGLDVSATELVDLAARVGSDVAFFLHGGFALGRGRGDEIDPLPDLHPFAVVIAVPPIEVSTALAYAEAGRRLTSRGPDATVEAFVAGHRESGDGAPPWSALFNEFEGVVTERWPEIGQIVRTLRATGTLHAAVTGSGAAVFGIYADLSAARRAATEIGNRWQVSVGSTIGRQQAGLTGHRIEHRGEEWTWK